MIDERRILELVEEILESGAAPEAVCAETPELIPRVLEQLKKLRAVNDQLETLFPPPDRIAVEIQKVERSPASRLPQIDGYEVEGILGHGGMGIVYCARHLKLKRKVALKMLLSGGYASPKELARFLREAEAVASLQHANIVQLHDVGELDSRPYFTMELIEGGNLSQKLTGTPQPARSSAELVATLARAVEFAHLHGIVHRDLKPANILLTRDGTPKIADFGLARRVDSSQELTLSGTRFGTPGYMAPEQIGGHQAASGPSIDVYALGAILYELLTGRPPFRAETAAETLLQVVYHEPAAPSQLNPRVPRDLDTICLKCLRKDPDRRYSTAAELADDLHRFQDGLPIKARPVAWWTRIWRWCRRNPALAAQLFTVLLLAGLITGGGMWIQAKNAQQRTERILREGQLQHAVEVALNKAADFQSQGRWLEAGAALESAQHMLEEGAPRRLRSRLRQAQLDSEMIATLEEARLRLSDGQNVRKTFTLSPEELYAEAFANYGIPLMTMPLAEASAQIRQSAIRDSLLAYLHDWLHWVSEADRDHLLAVIDAADDNEWRHDFRRALFPTDAEALKTLAFAPNALDQPVVVLSSLGGTLLYAEKRPEGLAFLRRAHDRYPADFWINFLLGLYWQSENPQVAIGYYRAAVAVRPTSGDAYNRLGRTLRSIGDDEGAFAAFRKGIALSPSYETAKDLAPALAPLGQLEVIRVSWGEFLDRNPSDYSIWYGYAQLCLFLGNENAYLRHRDALLGRFGGASNGMICERASLACLMRPCSESDLHRIGELVERVVPASDSVDKVNSFLQFLKGLLLYRQGRYAEAIPWLQAASRDLPNRAGPGLVLAMAEHQSGRTDDARRSLAYAVANYNWNTAQAAHATVWGSHVLRREAETRILPNLEDYLGGNYTPVDNNERLALLGIAQSTGRHLATAGLYLDAFKADPALADRLTADCLRRAFRDETPSDRIESLNTSVRLLAARSATLAGTGQGMDAPISNEIERSQWRQQAREWLWADLDFWTEALRSDNPAARALYRTMLLQWKTNPDLGGIRDLSALDKLPIDEGTQCGSLWNEVDMRLGSERN